MKNEESVLATDEDIKILHSSVGGDISRNYVVRLLKRKGIPITEETINLKTQALLFGRTQSKLKKFVKRKKEESTKN
ncbi:hypothetical protein ACFOWA_20045 [Pedobacter lithocola]|uniref:Uncharacterized protein n=1 Tax=Pedobacter lithocola TaxID=1908239 RepID=A0ABV8PIG4_9SPHI